LRPADIILDYVLYRHICKKVERRKTEVGPVVVSKELDDAVASMWKRERVMIRLQILDCGLWIDRKDGGRIS